MVTRVGVETLVLVVLKPLHHSVGATDKDSKTRRDLEDFSHCAYSQSRGPDSNGLYPAGPSLEGGDGERVHRFRRQYHRLPSPGHD